MQFIEQIYTFLPNQLRNNENNENQTHQLEFRGVSGGLGEYRGESGGSGRHEGENRVIALNLVFIQCKRIGGHPEPRGEFRGGP